MHSTINIIQSNYWIHNIHNIQVHILRYSSISIKYIILLPVILDMYRFFKICYLVLPTLTSLREY